MIGTDAVTDELYGLPLDQFIEVRNARAKAMAASGDRSSAASVRKLPKPSVAAWLGNVLVRQHRGAVDELIELGEELRRAQVRRAGDELRRLSARRQALVKALVALADQEAKAVGISVGTQAQRQLEATLDAAVADRSAASELRGGRLIEPLSHVGFGEFGVLGRGSSSLPPSRRREAQTTGDRQPPSEPPVAVADPKPLIGPDRALAKAQAMLLSSSEALDDARRRHTEASVRRREAATALRDGERELARASAALAAAAQRHKRDEQGVLKAEAERQRQVRATEAIKK